MKKIILLCYVLCMMVLLNSCNDNIEAELAYQVNLTVAPSNVINNFHPYYDGDFDLLEGDIIRINLFVYDQAGDLVERFQKECDNYYENFDFSMMLPNGDYTFIATSDVYTHSIDFSYWTFSNVDNINDFTIEDNGYMGSVDKLLGLKMLKVTVDTPRDIDIVIESATALFEYQFNKLHYYDFLSYGDDILAIDSYGLMIDKKADKVNVMGEQFEYYEIHTGYTYFVTRLCPWDYKSDVYGYSARLPIDNIELWVQAQFLGLVSGDLYSAEYWIEPVSLKTIESGKQYVIDIDIEASTIDVELASDNKSSINRNGETMQKASGKTQMKLVDLVDSNPSLKLDLTKINK